MDMMSIAATSIVMQQQQVQQAVGVSLMRKVMDQQEMQAAAVVESLQQAIPLHRSRQSYGYSCLITGTHKDSPLAFAGGLVCGEG